MKPTYIYCAHISHMYMIIYYLMVFICICENNIYGFYFLLWMKRKIVKHGPSSYIVSLPLEWIHKNNMTKGTFVNVDVVGNDVVISSEQHEKNIITEFTIAETGVLTPVVLSALYMKGVDTIIARYETPSDFRMIHETIARDSLDFEITETTKNTCTIRKITKLTKEFNTIFHTVLRRAFLVTLSLADEGLNSIKEGHFESLENIKILEKSNNKLTTLCRRYINKYTIDEYDKVGPLYYIVQTLDLIADQYAYLFRDIQSLASKHPKLNKKLLEGYEKANQMLRLYYECFYKFDHKRLLKLKKTHDDLDQLLVKKIKVIDDKAGFYLYSHILSLNEKIYSMVDPLLVLKMEESVPQ